MSDEENNEIESEEENATPEAEVETNDDPAALLEAAQKEVAKYKDEFLRGQAEMENLRRRQARDLENAHKRALDKFVTELLPIYDSMELGLNAANGDDASLDAVREGLDMTMKMFLSSLAKFGLETVNPEDGDAFDPELHQAMAMQPVEGIEANQILTVAQKGFQFNGRLLRPAMVMVSQ
jgi:molecular chaperone GrpE